jgi:MraZ protein
MAFTGHYEHVIDDKGRLAIPSPMRSAMDAARDGEGLYLMQEGRYLRLIPEKLFEQWAGLTPAGLRPSADVAKARRHLFSLSTRLEWDKQGRVMIPDGLLHDSAHPDPVRRTILRREVMLAGCGDSIEIWNRDDYIAHMREANADPPRYQEPQPPAVGSISTGPGGLVQ